MRLLSVKNPLARAFYETEALRGGWTIALVRIFEQALKTIAALPDGQRSALWHRMDEVRHLSHNFGYGVGDDMDVLLAEHRVDD